MLTGWRAGWRLLVFAAISYGSFQVLRWGAGRLLHWFHVSTRHPPGQTWTWSLLLGESLLLIATLFALTIMARIEGRSITDDWLPWRDGSIRRFAEGILWGLLLVAALIGLIYSMGGYSLGERLLSGKSLAAYSGLWLLTACVNGFAENLLFIGYPLFTLKKAIGFWPAALLLGLLFAFAHSSNVGENLVGLISIFLQFLLFALPIYLTGDLWLSIGLHAGGVFAEDFLFSVPDSGVRYSGHLMNSSFHGRDWVTGGAVGPEGSAAAFIVFVLGMIAFTLIHRKKGGRRLELLNGDEAEMTQANQSEPKVPKQRPPFSAVNGGFLAVVVPDLDASAKWYVEKLGLTIVKNSMRPDKKAAVTVLQGNGFSVELIWIAGAMPLSQAAPEAKGSRDIYGILKSGIFVDDLDLAARQLKSRDVTIAFEKFYDKSMDCHMFAIRDNNGNLIQFFGK